MEERKMSYDEWENLHQKKQSYFWKQKAAGILMLFISLVIFLTFEDEAGIGIFTLIFGIVLCVTRKKIMVISGFDDDTI